jgi:hypothetical protein
MTHQKDDMDTASKPDAAPGDLRRCEAWRPERCQQG